MVRKYVILWTLISSSCRQKATFFIYDSFVFAESLRPNPQDARNTFDFFHLCLLPLDFPKKWGFPPLVGKNIYISLFKFQHLFKNVFDNPINEILHSEKNYSLVASFLHCRNQERKTHFPSNGEIPQCCITIDMCYFSLHSPNETIFVLKHPISWRKSFSMHKIFDRRGVKNRIGWNLEIDIDTKMAKSIYEFERRNAI